MRTEMIDHSDKIFRFGEFTLDAGQRSLLDGERAVALAPKAFDTLLYLVENAGRILSKEKLMAEVWEESFVEENNLAQNISILRKALGETRDRKFIETVPKFGYRFVFDVADVGRSSEPEIIEHISGRIFVETEDDSSDEPYARIGGGHASIHTSLAAAPRPETRYVQNGDVNIAYQVVGDGPIDIVFVMGWVSHLEYFWAEPRFAAFLERLSSFSRLILFDKRGTGLSDRVPINELPTLEQRMEDVHAVMDAAGSSRAALIGVSEGGPMCSLFAATYPERTDALVMIGTYAKRIRDNDYPWAPTEEQRQEFLDLLQRDWGKPIGLEERAPSVAHDEKFRDWWATYLRMGASPGAAVALTKMNAEIDVREVLPSIRVPTLVIHRSGDECLKVEGGRYVASKIPGSRYVELGGDDHLPFVGDQNEILDAIEDFLTGVSPGDVIDRVLATVMNVKIADHNGDTEWALERSRAYIRRQIELFRGREISYDERGVLATFDGPARAIRCAGTITDSADWLGLNFQTGLHTGECDVINDSYSGVAVDLATRIAGEANPGNVLVSRTVKDLVAGSGLSFKEFGIKTFDPIEGEWRLFEVVS